MTTAPPSVIRAEHVSPDDVAEVLALARAAGDADGAYPLSEHVVLHLRHGGEQPAVHLLLRDGGRLVGYAHVDTADEVEGPSAELVVHPMYRRRGRGRALALTAQRVAAEHDPSGRLRLWAHGDHPSATALALSMGFERHRVLWQMRRSLAADVPAPRLPTGVIIRSFRPGQDEQAWLAANARAFVDHPEQGKWTMRDLRVRMAEPWFDPAGFLLAAREADDVLLGFHWTKVHGGSQRHPEEAPDGAPGHQHEPIGEVYVLGIDPVAGAGLGLGTALALAGLRYLRGRGLDQVMLYADESNRRAIALYEKVGFARWSTDVNFRRRTGQHS